MTSIPEIPKPQGKIPKLDAPVESTPELNGPVKVVKPAVRKPLNFS